MPQMVVVVGRGVMFDVLEIEQVLAQFFLADQVR